MSQEKTSLDALKIDRSKSSQSSPIPWSAVITVLVILILSAGVVAYLRRPPTPEVQTYTVRESGGAGGDQRTLLNASGYVTPRREATVSSKVTGKVIEVMVEEGKTVKEGQILARLDDTNIKVNLDLAAAQVEAARTAIAETAARLKEAELNLRRTGDLAREKIASAADLDHAQADFDSTRARLDNLKSQLSVAEKQFAVWQQQMDDMIIRAPYTGIVVSKNAQPGEMISPISAGGGFTRTGICTIVDMESLEIEVDVNESYINRVEAGQRVEAVLDSYPDWRIPAKVIAIIPTADRQKATVKVRVGFDKLDARILPQMGVKVAFQAAPEATREKTVRGISIPSKAVRQDAGKSVVWVVTGGRVERRAVTIQRSTTEESMVGAGLNSGEVVVVSAPDGLKEGDKVKESNK